MAALSRIGDKNQAGGAILTGASTVFCNGKPVGLNSSKLSAHAPWPKKQHPPHAAASTTTGSPSVFADGKPVLRVGSGNTCGHSIAEGSPDVNVP